MGLTSRPHTQSSLTLMLPILLTHVYPLLIALHTCSHTDSRDRMWPDTTRMQNKKLEPLPATERVVFIQDPCCSHEQFSFPKGGMKWIPWELPFFSPQKEEGGESQKVVKMWCWKTQSNTNLGSECPRVEKVFDSWVKLVDQQSPAQMAPDHVCWHWDLSVWLSSWQDASCDFSLFWIWLQCVSFEVPLSLLSLKFSGFLFCFTEHFQLLLSHWLLRDSMA